jgi:hypothetical protein
MTPHDSHAVDAGFAPGPGTGKGDGFECDAFISCRHLEPDRSWAVWRRGATGGPYLVTAHAGLIDRRGFRHVH